MTLKDQYLMEIARNITAPLQQKEQFLGDLRSHIEESMIDGETEAASIGKLDKAEDVAAEFMVSVELPYAGFWVRTLAFLVDMTLCLYTTVFMYAVVLGFPYLIWSQLKAISIIEAVENVATLTMLGSLSPILVPMLILVVLGTAVLFLLYFPILEARFGQTFGKRLLGLRVLKENLTAIGMKEAFLRRISYFVEILVIDALFIPFSEKKQRAFDVVASTVVVSEPGSRRNAMLFIAILAVFTLPLFLLLLWLVNGDPTITIRL
jgi:uncharacterized RDD family membrane protein YckC